MRENGVIIPSVWGSPDSLSAFRSLFISDMNTVLRETLSQRRKRRGKKAGFLILNISLNVRLKGFTFEPHISLTFVLMCQCLHRGSYTDAGLYAGTHTDTHSRIMRPSLSLALLCGHMSAYGGLLRETVEQADPGLMLLWRSWPGMEGGKGREERMISGRKRRKYCPFHWPSCGLNCHCQTPAPLTLTHITNMCVWDETYNTEPSVPVLIGMHDNVFPTHKT